MRYQYTENKVDDFVGYAQQQAIATGKATSADAVPGGKTDYNNFLFNAGILGRLTEQQQLWFNFSQGFEIPTWRSTTAPAPISWSMVTIACKTA